MARRIDIRTKVFGRLDWAPTQSDEAKARVNADINDALEELALDAPFMFEKVVALETQAMVDPFDATDTISASASDPFVIERDTLAAGIDADELWIVSGAWNARVLAVQLEDGSWRYHQIRDVWLESGREYMTLFEPQDPTALYAAVVWRVFTPSLWLPGDVSKVHSVRRTDRNPSAPLTPIPIDAAERYNVRNTPDALSVGQPRDWFTNGKTYVPSPSKAVTAASSGTWSVLANAEPSGSFRFVWTLCWGVRTGQAGQQPGARGASASRIPLLESAPSPASSTIDISGGLTAILVTFPDVAFQQGFRPGSGIRNEHAGWYYRLYVQRLSIKAAGRNVELPTDYQFLVDVSVDDTAHTYAWTGTIGPDPFVRLPDHTDYFGIGLHPHPDAVYPIEIRYTVMPPRLGDDYDSVPLPRAGDDILVELVLARRYEATGDIGASEIARGRAKDRLKRIVAQYGLSTPNTTVVRRVNASGKGARPDRRWYNTDNS